MCAQRLWRVNLCYACMLVYVGTFSFLRLFFVYLYASYFCTYCLLDEIKVSIVRLILRLYSCLFCCVSASWRIKIYICVASLLTYDAASCRMSNVDRIYRAGLCAPVCVIYLDYKCIRVSICVCTCECVCGCVYMRCLYEVCFCCFSCMCIDCIFCLWTNKDIYNLHY